LFLAPGISQAQESSDPIEQESAELTNIIVNKTDDQLEVKLEISAPVNYESFTVFNPNRVVIDLLQVRTFSCEPRIEINDFGVIAVRTAKNQPDVTRIVFELQETAPSYFIEEKEGQIFVYFKVEAPEEEVIEEEKEEVPPPVKKVETKRVERPTQPAVTEKPEPEEKSEGIERKKKIIVSFGGGYYFPQSSNFTDSYGNSGLSIGGGMGILFPFKEKENFGFTLDIRVFSKTGVTTFTEEEIKLSLIPISLAVFYTRDYGIFNPFISLGADYFSFKEEYPETFAISEISDSTIGYHIQLGTYVKVIDSLAFKVYFKFRNARKTLDGDVEVNLGGNEYGIGLAYFFKI
jgi:hypothetical protein